MSLYENHRNTFRCTRGNRLEYFAHRHREIELVFMLDGYSNVVVDGISYQLTKGDALIVFPNHLHKFISTVKEDFILFLIPANIYSDYSESLDGHRPVTPIIKNAAENENILTLAKLCLESDSTYAHQCRKFLIGAILGIVLNDVQLAKAHTDETAIERILDYCENHYTESISLTTLSKELFLSKFYISRLFSSHLGINFTSYVNSLRIEETVKLLTNTEMSITDICFATGFSSIRTFNRVFYNRIGVCPKEYRERQQSSLSSCTEKTRKTKSKQHIK